MLSWKRHDGCHYVSLVMYIAGGKFEEHCSNISRVILDWVLCCFSGTTYDVITFNTKTWVSSKRKKIFQKGKRHSSLLWKAFQISSNCFLLHRHFKIPKVRRTMTSITRLTWKLLKLEIYCDDHSLISSTPAVQNMKYFIYTTHESFYHTSE